MVQCYIEQSLDHRLPNKDASLLEVDVDSSYTELVYHPTLALTIPDPLAYCNCSTLLYPSFLLSLLPSMIRRLRACHSALVRDPFSAQRQ